MSASRLLALILRYQRYANVLNRHMVATNSIRNVDEPSPNIIDLIESGKITMYRHLGQGPPSGAWLGAYPPHRGRARIPA